MASQLYRVLNNIEQGRQSCVNKIKTIFPNVKNDLNLYEVAGYINAENLIRSNEEQPELIEDWVRPSEWPDCYSLLRNAEEKDNMVAGAIVLIRAIGTYNDTITLPHISANAYDACTGGDGYLMSDGTWYNNTTNVITHTWNKTKDIAINEGEYPGSYRWIIVYYNKTSSANQFNVTNWYPMEILYIGPPVAGNRSGMLLSSASSTIVNMEFLPECKSTSVSVAGTSQVAFYDMPELRNLNLGPITSVSCNHYYNNPTAYMFRNLSKIKILDFSHLTSFRPGNNTVSLLGCTNLTKLILPKDIATTIRLEGDYYHLTEIDAYSSSFNAINGAPYLKPDIIVNTQSKPSSWFSTELKITDSTVNNYPNLTTLYWTCPSNNSSNYDKTPLPSKKYPSLYGCPHLKNIIFNGDINVPIDISNLKLSKESILSLLEHLHDYSVVSPAGKGQPEIFLSTSNKKELNANEKSIITNKGWVLR